MIIRIPVTQVHSRYASHSRALLRLALLTGVLRASAFSQSDSTERTQDMSEFWHRKPALTVFYGITHTTWSALSSGIPNPGIAGLSVGRIREESEDERARTVRSRYDFVSLVNISNGLGTRALSGDVNTNLWRVGLGHQAGYGYELGAPSAEQALLLSHGGGVSWSRLTVKDQIAIPGDSAQLALYRSAVRFGMSTEAGMNLRVLPGFEIALAYERNIVFRRHQVGKWLGSVLTEGAAQWMVDRVVHRVTDASPGAGPVVRFLLKNGLACVAYQLRHAEMFFPFSSESPLANDSFTIGMTVIL